MEILLGLRYSALILSFVIGAFGAQNIVDHNITTGVLLGMLGYMPFYLYREAGKIEIEFVDGDDGDDEL